MGNTFHHSQLFKIIPNSGRVYFTLISFLGNSWEYMGGRGITIGGTDRHAIHGSVCWEHWGDGDTWVNIGCYSILGV